MNTVEVGNKFEDKIFEKFNILLENDELFINKKFSKLIRKPRYHSIHREAEIEFDISIETENISLNQKSLITIIECKKYSNSKVPIDDIEEFSNKLKQVGAHKGIVCTTKGFQKSCIPFARNNGIALARISPTDEIIWDLCRMQNKQIKSSDIESRIINTLTDDEVKIPEGFFCYIDNYKYSYSILSLLESIGYQIKEDHSNLLKLKITPPFITENEIHEQILDLFKDNQCQYNPYNYLKEYDKLMEKLVHDLNITSNCDLGIDRNCNPVIGKISQGNIYISSKINYNDGRLHFTLNHELAHKLFHMNQPWFEQYSKKHLDVDLENQNLNLKPESIRKVEFQANKFAANILLPDEVLHSIMDEIIKKEKLIDKGFGLIYVDHQNANRKHLNKIVSMIRQKTRASKYVIEIKLERLGYLKNRSKKRNALNTIIKNIESKYTI